MIRRAGAPDLPALQAIASRDGSPREAKAVESYLSGQGSELFVASLPGGGAVVGYLAYRELPDALEVLELRVAEDHQRAGFATALLASLINEARARPHRRICLEVSAINHGAQALYQRFGLTQVGRRKKYYPDGSDALLLDLDVSA